jgi:hypothetical protein
MSALGRRLRAGNGMAAGHPYGTEATPMVMPLAVVTYDREQALYQTLHPLITADGAVVPGAAQFYWPHDVAAHGGHDSESRYGQ